MRWMGNVEGGSVDQVAGMAHAGEILVVVKALFIGAGVHLILVASMLFAVGMIAIYDVVG
jgi:hypothetical protein